MPKKSVPTTSNGTANGKAATADKPQEREGEQGPGTRGKPGQAGGQNERRTQEPGMTPPEGVPEPGSADAVNQFDQLGEQPALDEGAAGTAVGALGGQPSSGPGAGILEQRLRQVEGDPSDLIRNQFRIEEMRQIRVSGGPPRETRPW